MFFPIRNSIRFFRLKHEGWDMLKRILKITALVVILLLIVAGTGIYYVSVYHREIWFNSIYRNPVGFNREPNALLVETVSDVPPGKALDIAMGEGRNAVWLATQGWDVTGFDISDEGLSLAEAQAAKAGVAIQTVNAKSEDFDYGRERWDLIVLSYAFTPIPDADYVERLRNSLKPGGLLVYEHFRQVVADILPGAMDSGEAPAVFGGFKILKYEEPVAAGDWANRKTASLVRLVATR
jgi:2-polyprenyl-3-methyl-5-hydroxy-6-metoxy-1,4-benzoquinol methylase